MPVIIIAGGTGMMGKSISKALTNAGNEVRILTRNPNLDNEYKWDIETGYIDTAVLENADVVINLAGANIGTHRWTAKYKKEILLSRVQSTKLIYDTLLTHKHKISRYISASAIGYYGHRPDEILKETASNGNGFLAKVCSEWEKAALKTASLNIPVAILRIGVVLNKEEGALPKMSIGNQFGFGVILGNGQQYISWIHIDDLVSMFTYIISNELSGIFNAVAPFPVIYEQMSAAISFSKQSKDIPIKIPEFAVKLLLGEQSEMVLTDTQCSAEKILHAGFAFQYPDIHAALRQLYT